MGTFVSLAPGMSIKEMWFLIPLLYLYLYASEKGTHKLFFLKKK